MPSISDAQALSILRESNTKTYDAQAKVHVAGMGAQVAAKQAILKSTIDANKAEQYAAVSKVATQGLGTFLNAKLNIQANKGMDLKMREGMTREQANAHQAKMAGIQSATSGGALGQAVGSMGDAIDQNAGFAKQASDAKIAGKQAEMLETMANQTADAAKTNKDKATKGIESAEEFAKGMFDRAKQVIDKAFGG